MSGRKISPPVAIGRNEKSELSSQDWDRLLQRGLCAAGVEGETTESEMWERVGRECRGQ